MIVNVKRKLNAEHIQQLNHEKDITITVETDPRIVKTLPFAECKQLFCDDEILATIENKTLILLTDSDTTIALCGFDYWKYAHTVRNKKYAHISELFPQTDTTNEISARDSSSDLSAQNSETFYLFYGIKSNDIISQINYIETTSKTIKNDFQIAYNIAYIKSFHDPVQPVYCIAESFDEAESISNWKEFEKE